MTRDELEFAISQYLDGSLAEADQSALEQRLATDAVTRALLAQYRAVDALLRTGGAPAIDHDALAARITAAVAAQPEPAQSYRLHWARAALTLALAACVVIAVGVGIRRLQAPPAPTGGLAVGPQRREPRQIVVVDTVHRATPSTAPVAVVSVGPSAAPEDRPALARYHEDLISRPSQVIIARSGYPAPDGGLLP
jgi:anti-sigma factor RsiW